MSRTTLLISLSLVVSIVSANRLVGQETRPSEPIPIDSLAIEPTPADTIPVLAPRFGETGGLEQLSAVPGEDVMVKNPRNAAIRAFLLPGWGQIYTGHPWRAVMFAAAEVIFLTAGYGKQREALDKQDDLQAAREEYFATDPDSLLPDSLAAEEAFDRTPEAIGIRNDLDTIEQRREDYYAYFALSVIFAAVDAYVAAQLDPLRVSADPATGRVWAGFRLPLGGSRPRADARGP